MFGILNRHILGVVGAIIRGCDVYNIPIKWAFFIEALDKTNYAQNTQNRIIIFPKLKVKEMTG